MILNQQKRVFLLFPLHQTVQISTEAKSELNKAIVSNIGIPSEKYRELKTLTTQLKELLEVLCA